MLLTEQDEAEWQAALRGRKEDVRITSELDLLAWEARRELAMRSLHEFVRQSWSIIEPSDVFSDNWHIRAVCAHLEAVSAGKMQRLIINIPPGTMKSLLVCVFWPAWTWAREPWRRFMHSSYAETLSLRDSIKTRTLVQSEWYQARWPLNFIKVQDGRFENTRGGWRIVGSIGGKGIGEHPDYNVADDPHNVLQAESEAERNQVTRWFEGVFCVRGEVRNAARVLVMQRLHSLDCTGVALEKGDWSHLCLPMRYETDHRQATTSARPTPAGFSDPRTEDGELLWPEKYTEEKVARLESQMGPYVVAGQLQQRPSPRDGGTFRREWFQTVPAKPRRIAAAVRYWDKAGTAGGSGARTAGVLMAQIGEGADRRWLIMDVVAGRWAAPERERVIKQTAETDAAELGDIVEVRVEQEPGSGGKESAEGTVRNLAGHRVRLDRVTGSKEVRAEPLSSQASVGAVALLAGAWNRDFLDELELFPVGPRKDQVDAASGAFNALFERRVRIGGW